MWRKPVIKLVVQIFFPEPTRYDYINILKRSGRCALRNFHLGGGAGSVTLRLIWFMFDFKDIVINNRVLIITVTQHCNCIYMLTNIITKCTVTQSQCPVLVSFFYLFSRLYDVSTSSCAHLTIILSSSSICLCHSSLLPSIPFPPSVL